MLSATLVALDELTWAGLGAVCAGVGSLLSGIAAYKLANRKGADEPEARGADR